MFKRMLGLTAAILVIAVTQPAFSEDELFDSKAADAYLEQGLTHLKARELNAAISALEESVSIDPQAEGFYYLGYAYYLKGRAGDAESRKKSIENFEKAYELDPNFTPSRYKPAENDADQQEPKLVEPMDPPGSSEPQKQLLETSGPNESIAKQQNH